MFPASTMLIKRSAATASVLPLKIVTVFPAPIIESVFPIDKLSSANVPAST